MQVEIQLKKEAVSPHAVIYTARLTAEVESAAELLAKTPSSLLSGEKNGSYYALKPKEIILIRMAHGKPVAYTWDNQYFLAMKLYELEPLFTRVSKTALINLDQLDHVEPELNGLMLGVMKNGSKEYISRRFVPTLKQKLGIGGK